jgi:hypothetical protein
MDVAVRTYNEPSQLIPESRRVLHAASPDLAIANNDKSREIVRLTSSGQP